MHPLTRYVISIWIFVATTNVALPQQQRPLTPVDIMKFKAVQDPVISEDGRVIAYTTQPDRGDGEAIVRNSTTGKETALPRATKPVISRDAKWVAATVLPSAVDLETSRDEKVKPKNGLVLLRVGTEDTLRVDAIDKFAFSNDSRWLAYLGFVPDTSTPTRETAEKTTARQDTTQPVRTRRAKVGAILTLRNLATGNQTLIPFVLSFAFDSASTVLAYSIADTSGLMNGLYYRVLADPQPSEQSISLNADGLFSNLTWSNRTGSLAFTSSPMNEKGIPGPSSIHLWNTKMRADTAIVLSDSMLGGWMIPSKNELTWSKDGGRLFFGRRSVERPASSTSTNSDSMKQRSGADLFDSASLLKKRELDVWHWNDPRIIPNQKKRWKDVKDQTYRAVYHVAIGAMVQLADSSMPEVNTHDNPDVALGRSGLPYLKAITWEGEFADYYAVNVTDGSRRLIANRLGESPSLSPGGRYLAFYRDKQWFLFDARDGSTRNLTGSLETPFHDEDNDRPAVPSSYGVAGWMENDNAVLIYDKYDIWLFPTNAGTPANVTAGNGRKRNVTYRIQKTDPDAAAISPTESLLLTAYHNSQKHTAFYSMVVNERTVRKLIDEPKKLTFLAKAKSADVLLFTRQSYTEFPDLWAADARFSSPKKISNVNPQIKEFAWGSAELVEWNSLDGKRLQGVLIKPGNYQPGVRYPLLVYFYERFSQRLYEFNQIVVNHRPCFPFYASNGYALFLPDVVFETGRPGLSAVKCVTPGVQKLIDMGIADPKAIGLHGHSWSGYETAFMITQTDMFACAIAGAPVANMTSAYSGIRLESGLARQFQYEQDQSRIGASMWEARDLYIENSPVFYADRINTPLLIEAGDEDEAVPWHQSVEMYLAMRRLGKDCVFLQYRGEPHHLKKYPNKLDYTLKMKEYLDHYLRGAPAPEWITNGVPYRE